MDVLKPPLLWLEGKCYRIPFSIKGDNKECDTTGSRPVHYEEDNNCCRAESDSEEDDENIEVDMTENGRYRTLFHVPRSYFACLIGPKGVVRRRIEEETNTQIRIPSKTANGDILITGLHEKDVKSARRRMNLIVMSARQKQKFTHFFSIPMTGKQIKSNFLEFKAAVCDRMSASNRIDASIFQIPEKLHLTLGTMCLGDDAERAKVSDLCLRFKETHIVPLIKNKPLKVCMTGVEYMNDDFKEVDILYGKVCLSDGSDLLQQLADQLVDYFFKEGFVVKKFDHVKLHVTLMNTLFRDEAEFSEHDNVEGKRKKRETFDATEILKMFQEYQFGEQHLNAIHLSQRFTTASDGYYQMATSIKL